ncbi:umecyanin-like [Eucalyptus grandis]|uniref:umecyanin-like n=1 Tax=Eucalyptus grandis TaxID=71139 RepID=UPI00192EDCBB|nr:umecyanin-like [Eucalyptus grandis]
MVSKMNMLVLMVFLGAAVRGCSAQTSHVVGDSLGWVVPPGGPIAYSTWAGNKTFVVGDTLGRTSVYAGKNSINIYFIIFKLLVKSDENHEIIETEIFNFMTGDHDVAEVTKAAYDGCNCTSPISLQANGPASIPLNQSGEHFYICTVGSHCSLGQKLTINVATTTPSPTGSATPPSPGNSAASLSVTGLFSWMLSVAVVLLY